MLPPTYTVFGTIDSPGLIALDMIAAAGVADGGDDGKPATGRDDHVSPDRLTREKTQSRTKLAVVVRFCDPQLARVGPARAVLLARFGLDVELDVVALDLGDLHVGGVVLAFRPGEVALELLTDLRRRHPSV